MEMRKNLNNDERIREGINKVLELFKNGDTCKTIALLTNPKDSRPCGSWSLRNKLIMFMNGTSDARGFNQWKKVKRYIRSGSKAFYILSPCVYKSEDKEGNEIKKLGGFKPTAVFPIESTEGEEIIYKDLENKFYDLQEVAIKWGIGIKQDYFSGGVYGCYSREILTGKDKKIIMASPEEKVFYHELAHVSHEKVGLISKRDKVQKEVVAEFVACVLCEMRGRNQDKIMDGYKYLQMYAGEEKVEEEVFNLIGDIEKTLKEILREAESISSYSGVEVLNTENKEVFAVHPEQTVL